MTRKPDSKRDSEKEVLGGRAGKKPIPRGAGRSADLVRAKNPISGAKGRRGAGGSERDRKGSGGKR